MAAKVVSMFLLCLLPFAGALITNASQGQQYGSSLGSYTGNPKPLYPGQPYYEYLQLVIQNPKSVYPLAPVPRNFPATYPHLTIHGLWPTNYSRRGVVSVENCSFTDYTLSAKFEKELDTFWPNAYGPSKNQGFRIHEYRRHGSCTKLKFRSAKDYFGTALYWYNHIMTSWITRKVPALSQQGSHGVLTSTFSTSVELAIGGKRPLVLCNGGWDRRNNKLLGTTVQLKEVVICLHQTAPGGLQVIDCPPRSTGQLCPAKRVIHL